MNRYKEKMAMVFVLSMAVFTVMAGTAMAAGIIQSTDSIGNQEINDFIVGQSVYVRGFDLVDSDDKADIYVVIDGSKPESWDDGEVIDNSTDHPMVLLYTDVARSEVDKGLTGYTGPKLLGVVGNNPGEIPAPGSYDIVYDRDQDGYFNASVDCVDYGVCSGFNTEIPEFATIALPALAVLGLFMFFNRRRNQK